MSDDAAFRGDLLHVVTRGEVPPARRRLGRLLVWGSFGVFLATFLAVALDDAGRIDLPSTTWRPARSGGSSSATAGSTWCAAPRPRC